MRRRHIASDRRTRIRYEGGPPVASAVSITGTTTAGQTLTGHYTYTDPESDPEGTSTFRWLRGGVAIGGATSITYALVVADIGAVITFEVTPKSSVNPTTGQPVVSAGTAAIAGRAPTASSVTITGTTTEGQTLTGHYTYADADGDAEGTSTFRWLRSDVAIGGATSITYVLQAADVGTTIKFEVTPVSSVAPTAGTPVQSSATATIAAAGLTVDTCESAWTGVTGIVRTVALRTAGTGYTVGDQMTVADGNGCILQVATVDGGGAVTSWVINVGGSGYSVSNNHATTGGTGTGFAIDITAVRNVTVTLEAVDFQVGAGSMKAAPSGSLLNQTLDAFHAISPGDLSTCTKLRMWYKNSNAISANKLRVCLCSDPAGQTVVDEFLIPATAGTGVWIQADIARTGGGSLGASIASIMLGTCAGAGSVTFTTMQLDAIMAVV